MSPNYVAGVVLQTNVRVLRIFFLGLQVPGAPSPHRVHGMLSYHKTPYVTTVGLG
jgi:hypothetical protein